MKKITGLDAEIEEDYTNEVKDIESLINKNHPSHTIYLEMIKSFINKDFDSYFNLICNESESKNERICNSEFYISFFKKILSGLHERITLNEPFIFENLCYDCIF